MEEAKGDGLGHLASHLHEDELVRTTSQQLLRYIPKGQALLSTHRPLFSWECSEQEQLLQEMVVPLVSPGHLDEVGDFELDFS
jgi:hypothetical protein